MFSPTRGSGLVGEGVVSYFSRSPPVLDFIMPVFKATGLAFALVTFPEIAGYISIQ